jgi:hypothetical protein
MGMFAQFLLNQRWRCGVTPSGKCLGCMRDAFCAPQPHLLRPLWYCVMSWGTNPRRKERLHADAFPTDPTTIVPQLIVSAGPANDTLTYKYAVDMTASY